MPPSTDCSACTSCGGCRSYAGGVAEGRLKSSATATVIPPSCCWACPHHHSAGKTEFGEHRRTERVFGHCYRRTPTLSRRPAAAEEDVMKTGGRRPSPVCTSICTTCGQVGGRKRVDMWRHRGTAGPRFPHWRPDLGERHAPAVDRRKFRSIFG